MTARTSQRRLKFIAGGTTVIVLIVIGLAFSGTRRLGFDQTAPIQPVRPGEAVTITVPEMSGDLIIWYEQAPLGRWYRSHIDVDRVADRWWWRAGSQEIFSQPEGPIGISEVEVIVPADARGSAIAVYDINSRCFEVPLDRG